MQTQGSLSPDMTMKEIVGAFPGAQRALFRHFHLGGCSQCAFSEEETLRELCDRSQIDDPANVLKVIEQSHANDQETMLPPEELREWLDASTTVCLLDVRTREEFEAVQIASSRLMSQPVVQEIMAHWNPADPIVIIDHTGEQSLDAAAYFSGHGFRNVRALDGGIDRWALEVDPTLRRYTFE